MTRHTTFATAALLAVLAGSGCSHNAPAPATQAAAPIQAALDHQASEALRWVEAHGGDLASLDSTRSPEDRKQFGALIGNARIVGVSELTEGTKQFAPLVQAMLRTLVTENGVRAIAIQAPMAEAFDIDRYVRGGPGEPRKLFPTLGSEHWQTTGFLDLVNWMRSYNQGRPAAQQIRFFGFELPSLTRATNVVTSLPDSVAGASLNQWLKRSYQCVSDGAAANWGREGYAADSTFWTACRGISASVVDSLEALKLRTSGKAYASDVAFAAELSRMVQHAVTTGLRHLSRSATVAEHVDWIVSQLGTDGKLLVWGRDVEAGRLKLDSTTVQMAIPLSEKYGDRYRALAFAVGDGAVRAVKLDPRQGSSGGPGNVTLALPRPDTYEDVLMRAQQTAFFLDMRKLPSDSGGKWLGGPHPMRLVSGTYAAAFAEAFQTPVEFPKYFDGILFIRTVAPATLMKR